jgi:hypothetical protein
MFFTTQTADGQMVYAQPVVMMAQPMMMNPVMMPSMQQQMGAPQGMTMDRNTLGAMANNPIGVVIHQTRKGWCQELMGCDASQEYRVHALGGNREQIGHADEMPYGCCDKHCLNSCLCKLIWSKWRPFTINVSPQKGAPADIIAERKMNWLSFICSGGSMPTGCVGCCCSACYQRMEVRSNTAVLGTTELPCYCCLPALEVKDASNNPLYTIRKKGPWYSQCCMLPCRQQTFEIVLPGATDDESAVIGTVKKLQGSLLKELMTDADTFEVKYPPNITPEHRALISASTFLIDMIFFESDSKTAACCAPLRDLVVLFVRLFVHCRLEGQHLNVLTTSSLRAQEGGRQPKSAHPTC